MEIQTWVLIFALAIILVGCPVLGRILYKLENKLAFVLYLAVSVLITILVAVITDHPPTSAIQQNLQDYMAGLVALKTRYIFSALVYIFSGVGIIGGILEYAGENTESAEAYKRYQKMAVIKLYLGYLVYGYIFMFAVYAFSQFLTTFLLWEYPASRSFLDELIGYLQFHNIALVSIGGLLFSIKAYRFGLFSFEFYRSEFHPSVTEIGPAIKGIRRISATIAGTISLFCSIWLFVIETFPNDLGENIAFGKSLFFLTATIQTILFYLLKDKYVDQLKPITDQYEVQPGIGKIKKSKPKRDEDIDKELQFED